MITRRSFLAALSALPFVGKLALPEPEPQWFFAVKSVPLEDFKASYERVDAKDAFHDGFYHLEFPNGPVWYHNGEAWKSANDLQREVNRIQSNIADTWTLS